MKLTDFHPKTDEFQTRFLGAHLPSGRVWAFKGNIKKLVSVLAAGFKNLWSGIYAMMSGFVMESEDTELMSMWETSLGIAGEGTNAERIDLIKAQIRKRMTVNVTEWSAVLSEAFGRTVTVYPAVDIDMTDTDFLLPNPVPTPLFIPNPTKIKQEKFIVMLDEIHLSEMERALDIVAKFMPTNVVAICIDRDFFFDLTWILLLGIWDDLGSWVDDSHWID